MSEYTYGLIAEMCEDKPDRYTEMVKSLIDKADMYASKVGGDIVSRQVI